MSIWKIISGIFSIVLSLFIAIQTLLPKMFSVFLLNGEISVVFSIAVATLIFVCGIVAIITRDSVSNSGNVILIILYSISTSAEYFLADNYNGPMIIATWCLLCAVVSAMEIASNNICGPLAYIIILIIGFSVFGIGFGINIFYNNASPEAIRVDDLIESIGDVSLESENKIIRAEKAVEALSEDDYNHLRRLKLLQKSREEYDNLLAQEQISTIKAAISAIGQVTLDRTKAIQEARFLYDKASSDVQNYIDNFSVLTTAEEQLSDLQIAEATRLISEIGTVTLNSKDIINRAREIVDDLNRSRLNEVNNLKTLIDAEATYKKLKDEKDTQDTIERVRSIFRVKRIWCSSPDSAGGVSLFFNFTNNSEKIIKYINFGVTFYNTVGDVVTCTIKKDVVNYCQNTGPYKKGEGLTGTTYYWGKFYNFNIKTVKLVSLEIEYMDGPTIKFTDKEIEYVQY